MRRGRAGARPRRNNDVPTRQLPIQRVDLRLRTPEAPPFWRMCACCVAVPWHAPQVIKADNAGGLEMINEHTSKFGYLVTSTTGLLDAAIEKIMAIFN